MEYEKCYVYQPEDQPPAKRRKLEPPHGLQTSWQLRRQLFKDTWGVQQQRIDERLNSINSASVEEIVHYLHVLRQSPHVLPRRIPAGLIVTGPSAAAYLSVLSHLSAAVKSTGASNYIQLSSSAGSNCKALLKLINQKGTSNVTTEGDDGDEDEAPNSGPGPRLLNYDLQILHDYTRDNNIRQVIIAFEDTEAFDSGLLSELLDLLSCWNDRIPFVLLFRIATSIEIFQQRLSKLALRSLDAAVFDIAPSHDEVEEVLDVLSSRDGEGGIGPLIWLGGNLLAPTLERQQDYLQTIDAFVSAAKYAYMSAFYANALTAFLASPDEKVANLEGHAEALRNTESFKMWAQDHLDDGDFAVVRKALEDDSNLVELARKHISLGQLALLEIVQAVNLLLVLQSHLKTQTVSSIKRSALYIQAMTAKLRDSTFVRNLFLSIRRLPSDSAQGLLTSILEIQGLPRDVTEKLKHISETLDDLVASQDANSRAPLRSENDIKNSTLRTTVIAKKVELSKHKSTLSKQDAAYTALLRSLTDALETHLSSVLQNPKHFLFNEIFLYDLRSPHREVFTPRPRHAIERALASPHDYLACECCAPDGERGDLDSDEATLSGTQPATAILYQLYLESGSLINVSDLWQAFQAVLDEDNSTNDQQAGVTKALFQRSLAELKALGMVKPTRRKVDHIQKVMWKGL
ncbi:hypothetical protein K431DRAFT_286249 [Polychaeton citri CBS 116435]|uniref:Origin recognition complex subunit n=1 Tax=Polychaeton citri CBS 116435 TaxID=1314669 RepID=A0A9P4UMS9_9PEZI|nr:hypothetical protein K431DRAFT_286249 [Polychaeton citri CBS 116435]